MTKTSTCLALLLTGLLAGCSSYAPDASLTGKDRAAVIASMGTPARERPHEGGTRLEYPRGQNTYFIDLDRSGRVARFENVLQPALYDRIRPGMSAADVEQIIGPASLKWAVARGDKQVWSYPFQRSICQLFELELSPAGQVLSVGRGRDPDCDSAW